MCFAWQMRQQPRLRSVGRLAPVDSGSIGAHGCAACASSTHRSLLARRTQDMLRDEFGIKALGKRLKILEAAKTAVKDAPAQPKKKKKAAAPAPAPASKGAAHGGELLRKRKGAEVAKPRQPATLAAPEKKKNVGGPDRRSMKQKIADPKTVNEINSMRGIAVQLSDFFSRTLGGARDMVGVGTILMCLGYWGATVLDVLPPGFDLLPPNSPAL